MESIIPESLRALTRWPRSPRTLGTRLTFAKKYTGKPRVGRPTNNNNTEISDDIDKANFINSYFTFIGENLSQKHSIPDDFDILNHIYRISPTTYSTEISITQIAKVKAKKAPGRLVQMGSHQKFYPWSNLLLLMAYSLFFTKAQVWTNFLIYGNKLKLFQSTRKAPFLMFRIKDQFLYSAFLVSSLRIKSVLLLIVTCKLAIS